MKVLILHLHFNTPHTGGPLRSYYLAKALVNHGIEAVVITAHALPHTKHVNIEGIDVHYIPVPYNNRFGFYKRSWSFIRFNTLAVQAADKIQGIDLCYAISVPLTIGLAAMQIEKKLRIPFVFEVGDLWPDAPVQMGFVRNYFFKRALYALERKIYRRSHAVVALSEPIRNAIAAKVPGCQVFVIPNMADTNYYVPAPKDAVIEDRFGVRGKFVVSYIGALGIANGLEYFLACARACQLEQLPVYFFLCGDGARLDHLRETARRENLANVSIVPFQEREGVRQLLNISDAAFVCYQPVPVLETGSPNKYFDGLAAGKLMVVNVSGWMRAEVEDRRCGFFSDPGEPRDFVNKLRPYLEDPDLLQEAQRAARILAEERYARTKLAAAFAAMIGQLKR